LNIRVATVEDTSLIFSFIQKKAEFDRHIGAFSGVLRVSEEKIRNTLFVSSPFAYVLLVENFDREIGFALYEFRYSSFAGQPSIWLDDLYIDEEMRSRGAGAVLMRHLAGIAWENHCTHLAWTADDRNHRGLSFYHRLGAEITEQKGHRCFWVWTLQAAASYLRG
jgi:GNAT superfamily N-acetyltransferase